MNELEIAKKVFQEIQDEFPGIRMEFDENDKNVDIKVDIPVQKGVSQAIYLNYQSNDELHFLVGNFWCEWFPCTNPDKVIEYKNAVIGYINGQYRILEHYKGKKPFKAELQSPNNGNWSTIATWGTMSWPFYFKKSQVVVQNA